MGGGGRGGEGGRRGGGGEGGSLGRGEGGGASLLVEHTASCQPASSAAEISS